MFYVILNITLVVCAYYLFTAKNLLTYFKNGNLWLSWLAIGVITLMDELTSIFYAPSEAFQHIGLAAIIFIPITSIVIRYLSTRMVQISELMETHNLKGGGVYNFSYLVLGPLVSFVAVGSILVDYVLTAAISTVSAVENATSFVQLGSGSKMAIEVVIVWLIAGLNILGIRENAKVTFGIFLFTAIAMINLVMAGIFNFQSENLVVLKQSWDFSWMHMSGHGFSGAYFFVIAAISNCILAYSGVESVLQTAKFAETWHQIRKSYTFLALSVGILIPILSVLVLTTMSNADLGTHRDYLITYFASSLGGQSFGILISIVASITLIMAVNTACVASSELIERVAHRYGFEWIVKTNKRASLYRIHIVSAILFTSVILMTYGQITLLAEMYAVGLVSCFVINLYSLLVFNYRKGTKTISTYFVSRLGTFILFSIILSIFTYLCYHKPVGFKAWLAATLVSLAVGFYGTRRRKPELKEIVRGETPMDIVLYIAELDGDNINVYFKRPHENRQEKTYDVSVYITLYSPRQKIPDRLGKNHFRIPFKRANIFYNMAAILHLLSYELPNKNITVHMGWPTASWFDRLSTGILVFQLVKLPQLLPQVNFKMERFKAPTSVKV